MIMMMNSKMNRLMKSVLFVTLALSNFMNMTFKLMFVKFVDNTMIKILSVKFPLQGMAPKGCLIDKIKPVFSFAVGILLVVIMLSALTSVARATTDKFGITELYPTASGGRVWNSVWDNGDARSWTYPINYDPDDSSVYTKGSAGAYSTDGAGILKISGSAPRLFIVDPAKIDHWHNVEITVYGMRISDTNTADAGIQAVARTNHFLSSADVICDTRGYYGRFRYDGGVGFMKETKHNSGYYSVATKTQWSGGLPKNVWLGYKYVVYDLPDGNVKLELYLDNTDGLDGGNWVKVDEFTDNGANFGVGGASCNTTLGIDPALRLTDSDIRPGSETGKPNLDVYWKPVGINTNGLWFKKASIRTIDSSATTPVTAPVNDTTPPIVSSTDPANSATNVSITKTITSTFSESIQSSTNYNSITLKGSYGNVVATANSISGSTLTIKPTNNLMYSTTYTVTIPASAVKDSANNNLASQYTFSFTTSAQPTLSMIAVFPLSASTTKGNTQQFTAQPKDQFGNPYPTTVTWTSSNTTVGTINSTGLFTAITPGTTIVTAQNGTITGTASATVVNQSSDAVAYWKFDENTGTTATDSSSNSNTGTVSGAVWTGGKIGNALSFNGVNNYVDAGNKASLNMVNAITIEAWVKLSGKSNFETIVDKNYNTAYAMWISSGKVRARVNATDVIEDTPSVTALDTWYHVAFTYDGSNVRLYANGVNTKTIAKTGQIPISTNDLIIGASSSKSRYYFNGIIDEVKVYNRALSASEVLADYNGG